MTNVRIGMILILAPWLLGLAGCADGEDVNARTLREARRLWNQSGIQDYNLEWTTSGLRRNHYLVYVRGGRVEEVRSMLPDGRIIKARPGDPSYYSVDGLFRTIEEELDQTLEDRPFNEAEGSKVLLKFEPDPKLGYPRSYRRDVMGARQGLSIDVVRFDAHPPEKIPPLPASPNG